MVKLNLFEVLFRGDIIYLIFKGTLILTLITNLLMFCWTGGGGSKNSILVGAGAFRNYNANSHIMLFWGR